MDDDDDDDDDDELFALCAGILTSVYCILNFVIIKNICNSFTISSKRIHT